MEEAAGYILKVKEYLCGQQNETLQFDLGPVIQKYSEQVGGPSGF